MTDASGPTVHASAVQVGKLAVLIRGASGTGKSRLAFDLLLAGRAGQIPPATLIGDDRVHLIPGDGQLLVKPTASLEGMIEIRGLGLRRCGFVAEAAVGLVVDLAAADATRLPAPAALKTVLNGVQIARIPVAEGHQALPLVIAFLVTDPCFGQPDPANEQLPEANW